MLSRALLPASIVTLAAGSSAHGAPRIALEGVGANADDCYPEIQILLEDEGYEVDIVSAADIDTLAEIQAYDAVLIGDSGHSDNDWADFDSVLTEYVEGGGGLLSSGWVTYLLSYGSSSDSPELVDLLPVDIGSGYESGATMTASGSHELTDGWSSFTMPSYSDWGGGTKIGADVAAATSGGHDGISYWEVGDGRVLHHGANYLVSTGSYGHESLYDGTDADARQSFINAVSWVAGGVCSTAPTIAMEAAGANATDTYPEIQALLEEMGWEVDIVDATAIDEASEIAYYDAVFLGDSGSSDNDWADFEDILLDYVDAGGGLLGSGWVPYLADSSSHPSLEELYPVESSTANSAGLTVSSYGTHELADDWTSFTAPSYLSYGDGPKTGAEVAAYDSDGNAAVVYWSYGDGRVVHLSPNYLVSSASYGHEELWDGSEPDAWQSFVNAAEWVADACAEIDPDEDGDGFLASEDCDDDDASVNPHADEVCDGVDNDCDGLVDNDVTDADTWYADEDEDGYGDPLDSVESCAAPEGYVPNDADCDDAEPLAWTGAAEVCDGVDNDCDGLADNDAVDGSTWFEDSDEDAYGDPGSTVDACDLPDGFVDNDGDCDDAEPLAWTGATEVCDDVDNDCDGTVDNDAVDATTWYADGDGDGFTLGDDSVQGCSPPDGYAAASVEDDCDDVDPTVYPGATEIEDDGIDQDCDGSDATGGTTGDGGATDGGTTDGGTSDGGTSDGGTTDGGTSDGGTSDGGTDDGKDDGCGGCASASSGSAAAWALPLFGLLMLRRRRG